MLRFVALVLAGVALVSCGRRAAISDEPAHASTGQQLSRPAMKPVYPYSVIPGGVEHSADLERAVENDPIVAEHYRDVAVSSLEATRLAYDHMAYVSFRRNGRIYWTSRRVRLAAGEVVFQKGMVPWVRARCGNRISLTPQRPLLPPGDEEPSPEALITPVPSSGIPYDAALTLSPTAVPDPLLPPVWSANEFAQDFATDTPGWAATEPIPPVVSIIVSSSDGHTSEPSDAPAVPEPSSVMLVIGGALICLLRYRVRR